MITTCTQCGREILGQEQACPGCGATLNQSQNPQPNQPNQPNQPPQPQNQVFEGHNNTNPYYNYNANNYNANLAYGQKDKHIKFIYVTSLIFMILFAIRTLSTLISTSAWQEISDTVRDDSILDVVKANMVVVFVAFAAILVLFTQSAIAKNRANPVQKRLNTSNVIFIVSIIALVTAVLYTLAELKLVSVTTKIIDEYSIDIDPSTLYGSIVFDITYMAFCIVNLLKAVAFKSYLKNSLNPPDNQI